jgi:multiple sugar transport system substrate-binding protein
MRKYTGKIILLVLLLVRVCGSVHPEIRTGEKKRTEIVYWTGWTGKEMGVLQGIIDRFNASQGRIHCRMVTLAGVYQKVPIAFAGGDVPDLMSTIWAEELAGYAMRGVLEPLDSYMEKSEREFAQEYLPGLWRMFQYEGKTYGLAMTTNGTLYYYNKDIFDEVGWGAERAPKTLEEFEEICRRCVKTDEKGNLVRYGTAPETLELWAYIFGGGWYDPLEHKVTANRQENVRALSWMKSQAEKYDVKKLLRFRKSFGVVIASANCPFYIGKAAIYSSGEYFTHHLNRYAPQIKYGWFPYPHPPGGRANCCLVGGSVFAIPSGAKHKEEAWELLNFLTQPESIKEFCLGLHNMPPLLAVAKDPAFTRDPVYRDLAEMMSGENVFGPPNMPIWMRYLEEIRRAEEYVIYGDRDPRKALDDVQARVEREFKRIMKQKGWRMQEEQTVKFN